jgi:hypothetical protein
MTASNNRKKKFIVLAAVDEKSPIGIHAILSDKIRQQLQLLRDKGYLAFIGKGRYKLL